MVLFATVDDLRVRWRTWPAGLTPDTAEAVLGDASLWLKAAYPDIPDDPPESLAGVLRLVTVGMAKRSLSGDGFEGVASRQANAGPFSHQLSYRNSDGALYLTAQERDMLETALVTTKRRAVSFEVRGW